MYDPPAYVWAITIAGPTAIAATTCIALYGGAVRARTEPTASAVSRRPPHFRRHAARCCGAKPGIPRPVKVPNAHA
jgi:hypothetical protein